MTIDLDRRSFLQLTGRTLACGALHQVGLGVGPLGLEAATAQGRLSGERIQPFSFIQLSDTHVGFEGPPNPLGSQAFERAVEEINALSVPPDLILFTGDLTHDSEKEGESLARMRRFQAIAGKLRVKQQKYIPGEHDAGLDGGKLYRSVFGPSYYAFDHRGVHFIALDNVSLGKPVVGPEQLQWLRKDLARFHPSTPIIVFTHRPLFDLKSEWEWYTGDGDEVMKLLASYDNVTILYGHIHRNHTMTIGSTRHFAARSLIFAFPDPALTEDKKPLPFDRAAPFKNLGLRRVDSGGQRPPQITEVELRLREFAGTVGSNQFLKGGELA